MCPKRDGPISSRTLWDTFVLSVEPFRLPRRHQAVDPRPLGDDVRSVSEPLVVLEYGQELIDLVEEVVLCGSECVASAPYGQLWQPDRGDAFLEDHVGVELERTEQVQEVRLGEQDGGVGSSPRDPRWKVRERVLMEIGQLGARPLQTH